MGFKVNHKGNFNHFEQFAHRMLSQEYLNRMAQYGQEGIDALRDATPSDSGKTANSWEFGIERGDGMVTLYWSNTNENEGVHIAVLLVYGHALQNGAYVEGVDFVNPALKPVFEKIAQECWKEVKK